MFQEIRTKRSLREVLPKKGRAEVDPVVAAAGLYPPTQHSFRWGYLLLILILVAGLVYFLSAWWVQAVVTVTPKTLVVPLNDNFLATKSQATTNSVAYEVMSLPAMTINQSVPATGEKTVATKATGEVVISNRFSSASQKLIATTRLQANDGRLYRLTTAVVVPGTHTVNGQAVPGQVTAKVVADQPGANYNGDLQGLVFPGFKGDGRYTKLSAETKAPLTGGLVGPVKVVDAAAKAAADSALRQALQQRLIVAARAQIPADFVLFDDAVFVDYQDQTDWQAASAGQMVTMSLSGTLRGIIFNRHELSRYVAGNSLATLANLDFLITNLDQLKFVINHREDFQLDRGDRLSFGLTGQAKAVATVDEAALRQKLAGVKKSEAEEVLAQFPGVESAAIIFRPPWAGRFPTEASALIITLASTPSTP